VVSEGRKKEKSVCEWGEKKEKKEKKRVWKKKRVKRVKEKCVGGK
jgi:hypothetical protein